MASIDGPEPSNLVRAAARGELPSWARAGPDRREHMRRVAALMSQWAAALELPEEDRIRWTAAGWLHDALKEEDPEVLRGLVPRQFRDLPEALLHGPAAAERIGGDADPALLDAVRFHTIGHPDLERIGRALYLADFLDPAREAEPEWRADLRSDMPHAMERILPVVVEARANHMIRRGQPIRPETARFLDSLASDA